MERRKALTIATAATLALGSGIVGLASMTNLPLLGFGSGAPTAAAAVQPIVAHHAAKPRVIVRTKNVYDRFVVDTGTSGTETRGSSATTATASTLAPQLPQPGSAPLQPPTAAPHRSDDQPGPSAAPPDAEPPETAPSTTQPSTTTSGPTTPTTQHLDIPDDWPPGKPIPPVPPNCGQPQLELNGVWNCQGRDD